MTTELDMPARSPRAATDDRTVVLISEPQGMTSELQFDNVKPYLPYVWAVLKTYHERNGKDPDTVEWLDPVWRHERPGDLLAGYGDRRIDVLGLSCYTWNWALQCEIARVVKERQPHCLVVAGGPEPDYRDPAFFTKHPYIDIVVVKDGEIPFSMILAKVGSGDVDFHDVPGLCLPKPGSLPLLTGSSCGLPALTAPAEVPFEFPVSPYVEQDLYYSRFMAGTEPGAFDVIMETNRGCPYGCSFCDWGSSTNSKVRRFDLERIAAEIDWFSRRQIGGVMLADANFGILPRDPDIAELLNQARERSGGYPQHIFWSAAKNNPERVIAIAQKFSRSGICTSHALSIQHTRKEVLTATARSNISAEKMVAVTKALMAVDVPIEVQLILGIPGDTYELWKSCLADLMEWGIHEDYLVQAYRLLPNAPAADAEFRERWQIKTVGRIMHDWIVRDLDAPARQVPEKPEQVVVSSATFDQPAWIRMSAYSAFVKAFHNSALLQRVAVYLRLTHDVPYRDFYESLIEEGIPASPLLNRMWAAVSSHYQRFLADETSSDHMVIEELPALRMALHPSRWIFVQACRQPGEFYGEVKAYLTARYPGIERLPDVIDYQRGVLITPDYDRRTGRLFRTEADWPAYFAAARALEGTDRLPEPRPAPGHWILARDTTSGERVNSAYETSGVGFYGSPLDWGSGNEESRWITWIERTVVSRSSTAMNNLQQLALRSSR